MAEQATPVSVNILDKEYMVGCPEDEREQLLASARFLNERMQTMRDGGNVLGVERIAVITALNIAHEFLQQCRNSEAYSERVDSGIKRLSERIDLVLSSSDKD